MSRSRIPTPFRPLLESLEARDVSSAAGLLLYSLGTGLQQQVARANADSAQLQQDVQKASGPTNGSSAAISPQAQAVLGDQVKFQLDLTSLKAAASQDQLFVLLASGAGLHGSDAFGLFTALGALNQANGTINALQGQVSNPSQPPINVGIDLSGIGDAVQPAVSAIGQQAANQAAQLVYSSTPGLS
jgi:hypothetical protein